MALVLLAPIWALTIYGRAPVSNIRLDRSDRVKYVRVKSIWIGPGFWAGLGSIFTGLLTANSITHWWVEEETNGGWYCVQFDKPDLTITKCKHQAGVTACGFAAVGYPPNKDKNISVKYSGSVNGWQTMGDVADFVKFYASCGRYDVILNNCQHFGKSFYYRFAS